MLGALAKMRVSKKFVIVSAQVNLKVPGIETRAPDQVRGLMVCIASEISPEQGQISNVTFAATANNDREGPIMSVASMPRGRSVPPPRRSVCAHIDHLDDGTLRPRGIDATDVRDHAVVWHAKACARRRYGQWGWHAFPQTARADRYESRFFPDVTG
jgi:hypothetical protein